MRSRYSAFAKSEFNYLLDTSQTTDREAGLAQLQKSNLGCKWLELEILDTEAGAESDNIGWVEFVASYFENGKICTMSERSKFEKTNRRWSYVDGDVRQAPDYQDQSMNGQCYCGSGKKFKRCHGE
jgi:SEC-C motif-containing protein